MRGVGRGLGLFVAGLADEAFGVDKGGFDVVDGGLLRVQGVDPCVSDKLERRK